MSAFDSAPQFQPSSRAEWRAWLETNHESATGVWLVSWRSAAKRPTVPYEAAVEEALCFGWVDSRGGKVDEHRTKLYFAPRKAGSGWAATNKERVERITLAGRMAPAGLVAVERAKADGSWALLDSVERLEVPPDLQAALDMRPPAAQNFASFPRSARRAILEWIVHAKRPATRATRIEETARRAEGNERANARAERV